MNSGNFSHCLHVFTVAALTTGTVQTLGILHHFFLIFGSTSTGSLLQHVHVLFSHNELTTFLSTQNDPSCHKTRFLGSKYHKNKFAAGALPRTPLGKLTSWSFVEGGKGKDWKNNGKGGTIEKGLQCPEFLTWKVGNPKLKPF